ncbi:hypothetical protein H072_7237 [Dactylellina haptotyla CBS 200.50]|uniref:Uncharacterized protein n=1 Tax=Dactylellina haptotyla (strain CBS 200.50) TaxID=1284197 RepID=S8BI66_DACHA|nr:hypothetical protein H072_7237 [Dactylellina haptotyla CBS 200.50]
MAIWVAIVASGTLFTVFAGWAIIWLFLYFIRCRREEICKLFKIGQKREDDPPTSDQDATGRVGGSVADSNEDTPLLISHDQIV